MGRSRRVLVATVIADLGWSPSLVNCLKVLAGEGFEVDLVARQGIRPSEPLPPKVHTHVSPWAQRVGLPGLCALRQFFLILRVAARFRPSAIIAVSPEALVLAGPIAVLLRIPLVLYSLEVRHVHDSQSRIQKWAERMLFGSCLFIITQDEARARLQLASVAASAADFVYVPNLPASVWKGGPSDYLRRRWSIPEDQVVVLTAGAISEFTMTRELVTVAQSWPEQWTLVVHGWAENQAYLESVRRLADGQRVILSADVVPVDEVGALVASADIGIALYSPLDPNILEMSRASGKIWQYLSCELPVVTVDFPTLKDWVEEAGFGICVSRPEDVEAAVRTLIADYDRVAHRARSEWDEHGDFAARFAPVVERLKGL